MKKKKIADFLPKPGSEVETSFLQAKIEKSLFAATKEKMKSEGHTWDQLVTACFQSYLSEDKTEK